MTLGASSSLAADAEYIALQNAIKNALTNKVGSYSQITRELASMGITVYTTTSSSGANKTTISLNKEKFINAYLENPDKVLDILVGNDTKPIDSTRAGSMTRLSDTLQNAVNDYFAPSINNLETQSKNIALQIAQYTSELNNITNSLSLDDPNGGIGDVSEYLKQLEEQYEAVNKLIKKMKNNYNNSITRLALRV
jgi:hypothetical protein